MSTLLQASRFKAIAAPGAIADAMSSIDVKPFYKEAKMRSQVGATPISGDARLVKFLSLPLEAK